MGSRATLTEGTLCSGDTIVTATVGLGLARFLLGNLTHAECTRRSFWAERRPKFGHLNGSGTFIRIISVRGYWKFLGTRS